MAAACKGFSPRWGTARYYRVCQAVKPRAEIACGDVRALLRDALLPSVKRRRVSVHQLFCPTGAWRLFFLVAHSFLSHLRCGDEGLAIIQSEGLEESNMRWSANAFLRSICQ